jgi:hypothetical protein
MWEMRPGELRAQAENDRVGCSNPGTAEATVRHGTAVLGIAVGFVFDVALGTLIFLLVEHV